MSRAPGQTDATIWTILVWLVLAMCCALVAIWAGRGFDISDDAFYIVSSLDAGFYRQTLIEFGYFWRTIFRLLGGDLYLLRLSGIFFLLACATWFAAGIRTQFFSQPEDSRAGQSAMLAIVVCGFWQYGSWLPTPSYNLLNLGGLLLFFGGLLLAPARDQPCRGDVWMAFVAMVAGAGLCLTMLAKPTTTVAVILLGILWVVIAPPRRLFVALLIAAMTAVVGYAVAIALIDGSVGGFLARKAFSLHAMAVLDRGNNLAGLGHTLLGPLRERGIPKVIAVASVSALFLAILVLWWRATRYGWRWLGAVVALALAALLGAMRARDFMLPLSAYFHFWHLALLLPMLTIMMATNRAHRGANILVLGRPAILAMIPLAYSVGTNTTIFLHVSGAAIFWCTAAIAFLASDQKWRPLVPQAAFLFAVFTLGLLAGVAVTPLPNSAPLWRQSEPLLLRDGMQVNVDRPTVTYMNTFQLAARTNGFRQGMPILDLTGQGPGLTLALGGVAPAVPWLHHGGANVMAYSALMLSIASRAQLRAAWIITSPGAGTMAESKLLHGLGLDFPRGYRLVTSRTWPAGGMEHALWKPEAP